MPFIEHIIILYYKIYQNTFVFIKLYIANKKALYSHIHKLPLLKIYENYFLPIIMVAFAHVLEKNAIAIIRITYYIITEKLYTLIEIYIYRESCGIFSIENKYRETIKYRFISFD